jgi:heptosyltransferase-1
MRVLIVKTSSLGDLIHTFPAITDAAARRQDVEFHWLVEEAFEEVPGWHPAVSRTIILALRRWRRQWLAAWRSGEPARFREQLREGGYDLVIDAQGLLKSAVPARLAGAPVAGYDRHSIREPLASLFYRQHHAVSRELHAIERIRRLLAHALHYPLPDSPPDYGLELPGVQRDNTMVFLHATTWSSKHWPEDYWIELAGLAGRSGFEVWWPWYSAAERARAERLRRRGGGQLLPRLSLTGLRDRLATTAGVVGVDTGLAHLAAAVGTPAVTLYGPTRTRLTGALGPAQENLSVNYPCAPCMQRRCDQPGAIHPPCFASLPPHRVWQALRQRMQ